MPDGAMLGDPSVREGYVQGAMARGFEAAGSNGSGAMAGFMGMGAGMNFGGGFMGAASASNLQQMQMQQAARQGYASPQGGYAPPPPFGAQYPGAPGYPGAGQYSVGDAFSWAWNKFSKNVAALIVPTLVYVLIVAGLPS